MDGPIVNVRHAAPFWQIPSRGRYPESFPTVVRTPVVVREVDPASMRLAYVGHARSETFVLKGEEMDAPLWECERRLWQAATTIGPDGTKRHVGTGWLTGEGEDATLRWCSLNDFASCTPLCRSAVGVGTTGIPERMVESHIAEARAGLINLVTRDLRLCGGTLYHAFQGVNHVIRPRHYWSGSRAHFFSTSHARNTRSHHEEWYIIRCDRMAPLASMVALTDATDVGGPILAHEIERKAPHTARLDGNEDVLSMVNALPTRLIALLRRGGVERSAITPKLRNLDMADLRRPMALGRLGLIDTTYAAHVIPLIEAVVDEAIASRLGVRLRTELVNVRAYLASVAVPVLGANRPMAHEDAMALEGIAA